jgi:hypothetical protein
MDESRSLPEAQRVHPKWRLRKWWPVGLVVVLLAGYGSLAGLAWSAQAGAHKFGERAMRESPGDEVEALISFVQSENHALAERSRAVHALGQIGSERALPILTRYYTGRECEHSKFLCQKELRKAIDRCSGKNWAPSWLPFFPRPPVRGDT